MMSLEQKMRLIKKIFTNKDLDPATRTEAFKLYRALHALRPAEVVKKMEKEQGLAS